MDVSFFIPVYKPNRQWLDEAVASIYRLTQRNQVKVELLLGDDGSPEPMDLTVYEKQYPGFVRSFAFPHGGVGITSTRLSKLAEGRYISSFDEDDIMLPFDLDGEVDFMDKHPEYSASYGQKFLFNEYGLMDEVHGDICSPFETFFSPKVNINATLIRREVLKEYEYFKPLPFSHINHDTWLMIRLMERGVMYYSRKPRALYRIHGNQISREDGMPDWHIMSQYFICRNPEKYNDLLFSDVPAHGKDEQDELMYLKLMGLVFFENQKKIPLAQKMLRLALERHPEDFGVWEVNMMVILNSPDTTRFMSLYRQAVERFHDDPDIMLIFTTLLVTFNQQRNIHDPELIELNRKLFLRRNTPPPIVTEEIARLDLPSGSKRQSYSFNLPGLKI